MKKNIPIIILCIMIILSSVYIMNNKDRLIKKKAKDEKIIVKDGIVSKSIFREYYVKASNIVSKMTLKENQTLECLNESFDDGNVMYAILEGDDTGNVDETVMDSYRKSQQGIIDKVGMLLLVPTKNVGKGKIFEDSDVLSLKEGFKLIIKYKGGLYIDENDKIDFDGISSYLIENGIPKQNIVLW